MIIESNLWEPGMSHRAKPFPIIDTPRLKLCYIENCKSLATIIDILMMPDIYQEIFRPGLTQEKLIHHLLHTPGVRSWIITDARQDRPIGFLMVLDKNPAAGKHRRALWPEITYAVHPAARGRGFAFEACKALCNHLILREGASGIAAWVHPHNTGSIRLLEKLGMVLVDQQPEGLRMSVGQGQFLVKRVERLIARIDWSKARTGLSGALANLCGFILYLCY